MAPQNKDAKSAQAAKTKSKGKAAGNSKTASAANKHPGSHAKDAAPTASTTTTTKSEKVIKNSHNNNVNPANGQTATVKHHPHLAQQGPPPAHVQQHPRPSSIVQQQQHHPGSPRQPAQAQQHPGSYTSPQIAPNGLPLQHPSTYPQQGPGTAGQAPPEVPYYGSHATPYGTQAPAPYTSSEAPELMAAAHMQRPPYNQQIYHTPQSNSPASVASPQSHDYGRMYGQTSSQMGQTIQYPQYPPMSQVPPYAQHSGQASQQSQQMPAQPTLMQYQQAHQQALPHQPPQTPTQDMTNSPRPKLEPSVLQRPIDSATMQRSSGAPLAANGTPSGTPSTTNGMHQNTPGSSSGVNSNAAPGPIPATTPLVVRQDNNGVQWIAFEYSRDRVKMEYTIRCDVESVNVDNLSPDFKTENCVYPRACCSKDQYRGNRLVYETECNTVGWALADLNACLRGKRGLIQRAVDSWRNSNQDPKLRSRRVRRMAKLNNRKQSHTPGHMPGPGGPSNAPGIPSAPPMAAPLQRQPQPAMGMGGPQLHHHHNHPDGNTQNGNEDVSGSTGEDVRPTNVFHGYPSYPSQPPLGASMAPQIHDGMAGLASHNQTSVATVGTKRKVSEDAETMAALYGDLPEAKRRKFILVDDSQRGTRVRVRVTLDQVEMNEIPDSYRKANSVYPRAYFPMQMQSPSDTPRNRRMFAEDEEDGGAEHATVSRTTVPIPLLEGGQELPLPRISKAKRKRENTVNEMGYRMSWSQSRVFAGRILFLQKSLDAYRNKMRTVLMQNAQSTGDVEPESVQVAPQFLTRIGKQRWLDHSKKAKKEDDA